MTRPPQIKENIIIIIFLALRWSYLSYLVNQDTDSGMVHILGGKNMLRALRKIGLFRDKKKI